METMLEQNKVLDIQISEKFEYAHRSVRDCSLVQMLAHKEESKKSFVLDSPHQKVSYNVK